MGTLLSFLVHPFSTVNRLRDQYDEEGSLGDLIYHLTLFFAFGIYTVIRRHLNAQSRAKSFYVEPPEVGIFSFRSQTRVVICFAPFCSKRILPGPMPKQFTTLLSNLINTT